MSLYLTLFARGFVIVALTAANVSFIAQRRWLAAFLTGFGISAVWYSNSFTAAHEYSLLAAMMYAGGAALGTVTGMWVAGKPTRGAAP